MAESLPAVVLRGKAPSTVKKYSVAFVRWKKWASARREIEIFPVQPLHLSLYLSYLIQKSASAAPVEHMVCAISWVHTIALQEDPTEHSLVKQVVAGAKRILAKPTSKKEPVTSSILRMLVDKFGSNDAPLSDVRTLSICLLSFAGFLRYDEIANLKETDVSVFADHAELYIESSKTDQYRDGTWVVIARTQSDLCLVVMLEHYMKLARIEGSFEKHLFRGLTVTKNGAKLIASIWWPQLHQNERVGAGEAGRGLSVSIAYVLGVHLPLLMRAYQTDGSRDMVDGEARVLRMAILRIVWRIGSRFPVI